MDCVSHLWCNIPNPLALATSVVTRAMQASISFAQVCPDKDEPCAVALSYLRLECPDTIPWEPDPCSGTHNSQV